jgi:hypothetical protein
VLNAALLLDLQTVAAAMAKCADLSASIKKADAKGCKSSGWFPDQWLPAVLMQPFLQIICLQGCMLLLSCSMLLFDEAYHVALVWGADWSYHVSSS